MVEMAEIHSQLARKPSTAKICAATTLRWTVPDPVVEIPIDQLDTCSPPSFSPCCKRVMS